MTKPLDRSNILEGKTYKVHWPESDHAIYITINDLQKDGKTRPFEIFINSKNMEYYAWTLALTSVISAVFRRGEDISFVVEELKTIFDPRGGHWVEGKYIPSLLAAIGQIIEKHLKSIGFVSFSDNSKKFEHKSKKDEKIDVTLHKLSHLFCPRCNQPNLIHIEGCESCTNCEYSRCA